MREQEPHDRAGKEELRLRRDPHSMPAAASMEELLAAQPEPGHEMLEVGHRRSGAADHGGVEGAAPRGEQSESDEPAADLEAPVGNVLVRYVVACDMQRRPEDERERSRADERAGGSADRDVERDDHRRIMAYALAR